MFYRAPWGLRELFIWQEMSHPETHPVEFNFVLWLFHSKHRNDCLRSILCLIPSWFLLLRSNNEHIQECLACKAQSATNQEPYSPWLMPSKWLWWTVTCNNVQCQCVCIKPTWNITVCVGVYQYDPGERVIDQAELFTQSQLNGPPCPPSGPEHLLF